MVVVGCEQCFLRFADGDTLQLLSLTKVTREPSGSELCFTTRTEAWRVDLRSRRRGHG